jgi:hypothetical protein
MQLFVCLPAAGLKDAAQRNHWPDAARAAREKYLF